MDKALASRQRQALRLVKGRKRREKIKTAKKVSAAEFWLKEHLKYNANTPVLAPVASVKFLDSFQWRKLRMEALKKYGATCQCCGASRKTGAVINVDHIKPRKLYPQLALSLDNLQILCHECNHGKGNWDTTDWR